MPDLLPSILASLKSLVEISPRFFFLAGAGSGFILFAPDRWLDALGLRNFRDNHRTWLGLALLASALIVGLAVLDWFWCVVALSKTF